MNFQRAAGKNFLMERRLAMLNLFLAFALGLSIGLAICWSYILSLRAKVRFCMSFIQERIERGELDARREDHVA